MLTILIHDFLLLLKIDIAWEASWFTKSLLDNTSTSYDDHLVTTWMVKCYPYWQFENYFTSFLREFLKGKRGSRCCFSFPFYIPMVALSVRSFFFFFFFTGKWALTPLRCTRTPLAWSFAETGFEVDVVLFLGSLV